MARIVLLTEGQSNPHRGKTASGILRYRTAEVVGIVDSKSAGRTAQECFGVGGAIRIAPDLSAFPDADELLIGVAPAGPFFPPEWRAVVLAAVERGMNVTSGIHVFLSEDPEIRAAAERRGVRLYDVRRPPEGLGCSKDKAKDVAAIRVHTVGLDCGVGKMTVSLEIDRELRRRGRRSRFLATGQTGIMIAGEGLPIDRIISDFVAGASERLIMENQDYEYLQIEGQGSLFHPLFSGVTLGLLHGCAPDLLIMCYLATRKKIIETDRPIPSLSTGIECFEKAAAWIHPAKVVGIAANTWGMNDEEARREVDLAHAETGLPVTDVFRFGIAPLADAILAAPRPCDATARSRGDG